MPYAPINGTQLFYESHGDGPAIVFAHGRGGNHLSWWQQVAEFQHDYRCITFDHRGWGLPPGPDPGPNRIRPHSPLTCWHCWITWRLTGPCWWRNLWEE